MLTYGLVASATISRFPTIPAREERHSAGPPSHVAPLVENEHPYLAARATNRATALARMRNVGIISALLSTLGLSLLRKRGRAGAGAVLLASAAGLSLLKRGD